ncbi:MAG: DUF3307 domain-containing protein, partial [Bacteroidales bacterium]|nr:DUF3307 domain-containing protein [Bacteroidales bacterium]
MSVYKFLLLQFIAHLLSDFIFQNEKWATLKNQIGFKSKNLKWHILITFLFSLCLSFQLNFIFYSLAIASSHWLIDGFKIKLKPCKELDKYIFF